MDKLLARYTIGFWDEGDEYLRQCYLFKHNDDYLEFLVKKVWGLKDPIKRGKFDLSKNRVEKGINTKGIRGVTSTNVRKLCEAPNS